MWLVDLVLLDQFGAMRITTYLALSCRLGITKFALEGRHILASKDNWELSKHLMPVLQDP